MARTTREWTITEKSTRNCLHAKVFGDRVLCENGYPIGNHYGEYRDGGMSLRRVCAHGRLMGDCRDCAEWECDQEATPVEAEAFVSQVRAIQAGVR